MINSWHTISEVEKLTKITRQYKPYMVELLKVVKHFLNENNVIWFLEGGSALGAFRNGKIVPHDDDIDIGIYGDEHKFIEIFKKLQKCLPSNIECRLTTSYCKKIEVYEPKHGKFKLDENNDYHHVSVDLLLYKEHPNNANCIQSQYFRVPYYKTELPKKIMFPPKETMLEGVLVNGPNNLLGYLKLRYGYLGEDCYYDKETNLYKKRDK